MSELRYIRLKRNLKQSDIAKIIDTSISTVSKIERGDMELNEKQIIALCNSLDISADKLLGIGKDEVIKDFFYKRIIFK